VVTLGSEDLIGRIEKLDAPLIPGQSSWTAARSLLLEVRGHEFTLTLRRTCSVAFQRV
jgi:hypothetical protein